MANLNWINLVTSLIFVFKRAASSQAEIDFVDGLLSEARYDKRALPGATTGSVTPVTVDMYINGISSVSEIQMDFVMDIFLRQVWTDPRLEFPSGTSINRQLTLHESRLHQLWVPDLYISNSKTGGGRHTVTTPNRMITLSPKGEIFYSERLSLVLACDMKLQEFPIDNQTCPIYVESYSHPVEEMTFTWRNVSSRPGLLEVRSQLVLPEFNVSRVSTEDCTATYSSGAYPCLRAWVHLERMQQFYLVQVFIPSILVVILSWVSFWIDYQAAPARISIGLLTVLTITTQASGVSAKLPKVSYIKAIDIWMFTNMVLVFLAMLEYAVVNSLARSDKVRRERRLEAQGATNRVTVTPVQVNENDETTISAMDIPLEEQKPTNGMMTTKHPQGRLGAARNQLLLQLRDDRARLADSVSRAVFPLVYVVFNVYYWATYEQ